MKWTLSLLLLIISLATLSQTPSRDWQIKTALLALPESYRADAAVLGFNENGELVSLKEGSNQYICLADDPTTEGFGAAAYHKDLEPFMARGRQLKAEGKGFKEIFDIREEEVKSGKLEMPDKAILYVFNGTVNEETRGIENPYVRYVIYIPYATPESTGLPTSETAKGHPWIMDPGTHRAHIMITPPRN